MIKFNKNFSNYQTEEYLADCEWQGYKVRLNVTMQYHTFRKYWHVNYSVNYGRGYTFLIDGKSYIDDRKTARIIAIEYMQKADVLDVNRLDDFQRRCIKDNATKVGGFTSALPTSALRVS